MQFEYDEIIRNHYNAVADEFGLSPSSTMGDEIVRKKETKMDSFLCVLKRPKGVSELCVRFFPPSRRGGR